MDGQDRPPARADRPYQEGRAGPEKGGAAMPQDPTSPQDPPPESIPDAQPSAGDAPPPHEVPPAGWGRGLQGLAVAAAVTAAAAGSYVLFRMLNRTRVHGLENIPTQHHNVLYCLNHNSILDNFAFEAAAYIPKVLFQPKYLPISLADRKNFFGDPSSRRFKDRVLTMLGQHFFRHLRAYPVDRKSGDFGQVDRWIELLRENIVIVFPEGTRTRTGEIGPGKPGVGKMIYEARPVVIPVHMAGTGDVLGVGRRIPRIFRTVNVHIGAPMDLREFTDRPLPAGRKEQIALYAEITERVLAEIRRLGGEAGE